MGQKVNPNALRIDINRTWISKWVTEDKKQAARWIVEDEQIRKTFLKKYHAAQIVEIDIERNQNAIIVNVKCGQPGLILGENNANLKDNVLTINKIVGRKIKVTFNVVNYEATALSARIIAREIADAIENRVSFRVAQKMGIKKAMSAHAKGIKTNVSGRLGGVEIAREEGYSEGVIPLSTLRANIDYACEEASTTYGQIGVKVWINRGVAFKPTGINNANKPGSRNRKFDPNKKPRRRRLNQDSANTLRLPKEEKSVKAEQVSNKEAQ